MLVEIYTRPTCNSCTIVKKMLEAQDIAYKEYIVDVDITREQILEQYPGKTSLPIVVAAGKVLSGVSEVEQMLTEYKMDFGKTLLTE